MRRRFGMLVGAFVAVVGLSLIAPDTALARRCGGRHHRHRGGCGAVYSQCGAGNCGYGGCGTGGGYTAPANGGAGMSGPAPAGGGSAPPPPPAPSPGA